MVQITTPLLSLLALMLNLVLSGCAGETCFKVGHCDLCPLEGFPDDFLDYEELLSDLRSQASDESCGFKYRIGACEEGDVLFIRYSDFFGGEVFYYDAATGRIIAHEEWDHTGCRFWPQEIDCTEMVTEEICLPVFNLFGN